MYVIALTFIFVGQTLLNPKYAPFELRPGDKTYRITYVDESMFRNGKATIFVRRTSADWNLSTDTVEYRLDDFDKSSKSPVTFTISEIREELESEYGDQSRRQKRLEEQTANWHATQGNESVTFANGSTGWVTQQEAEWSRRAREAAIAVIDKRVALESANTNTPAITPGESSAQEAPGILQLWGPQAAVGVLGLVLMSVVGSLLIFSGERGWQKIE